MIALRLRKVGFLRKQVSLVWPGIWQKLQISCILGIVRTLWVFPADEADEEDLEEVVAVAVVVGLELTFFLLRYLRVRCCSLSSSMARPTSPALVIVSEFGTWMRTAVRSSGFILLMSSSRCTPSDRVEDSGSCCTNLSYWLMRSRKDIAPCQSRPSLSRMSFVSVGLVKRISKAVIIILIHCGGGVAAAKMDSVWPMAQIVGMASRVASHPAG